MKEIDILDNYVDEREFRNIINSLLIKQGFTDIVIDDVRISDDDNKNNNDIFAKKKKERYTIQTFLNKDITEKELKEAIKDMEVEYVKKAIVVTNKIVEKEVIKDAKELGITVWDRKYLEKNI